MHAKEREPSKVVSLTETTETISALKQLVVNGNAAIAKHNETVDNHTSEKNTLVADIWEFLMDENERLISEYLNSSKNFNNAISGIREKN